MIDNLNFRKIVINVSASIVLLFLVGILFISKAKASNFNASNYTLSIDINENKDATFYAQKTLTNTDAMQIVSGYEYILPSSRPQNVVVFLNDVQVSSAVYNIDDFNYSKISINFGSNVIKSGETKTLKITATVKNFIKTKDNISFFKVLASKDEGASLTITYPFNFGKPRLITVPKSKLEQINEQNYKISLDKPDSMLVIWGESYTFDIKSKFELINNEDKEVISLTDLPSDRYDQEVGISHVTNSEFGLYNVLGNTFSQNKVKPSETIEAGFEAKIKKTFDTSRIINTEKYEFGWPMDNDIVKAIEDKTKDENNLYAKLNIANDYLTSAYITGSDLESNFDFSNKTSYWKELLGKNNNFASFDYCYVMVSYAEHLGMKTQMNYGYIVLPDDFGTKADPQFWCYFEFENKTYLMDPYSLSARGFDFFGSETEFDRITIGIWNPSQSYNRALGLLDKNNFVKQIEFFGITDYDIPENSLSVIGSISPKADAGFYHSLNVEIKNNTYKFIKLLDVAFDGNIFTDAINYNSKLKLALLPNQLNSITLKKLRNYNFLENGERLVNLELKLEHPQFSTLSSEVMVNYKTTKSLLIVVSIIVILILIICLSLLIAYRFKQRRTLYGN